MKTKLLLAFFLPIIAFGQTQLGNQLNNPDESNTKPSKFGTGVAISNDGSIIAVGAPGNNENSFVRVFKYENNDWQQLGSDIVNESILEKVGSSVSLSADGLTLAIGAVDGGDLDEGLIRIYQFIDNKWEKTGQIVGDGTQFYLGYKVILTPDAKFLAASAYRTNSSKKGTVKVYENISGTWTQRGTNLEGDFTYDAFGFSIDLSNDGNVLAVANKGRQKVHVYKFNNNDWEQIGEAFTGLTTTTREFISVSLSSNGNIVSVGSKEGVSVYENKSGVWSLIGSKINYGSSNSISADGHKIAISSPYNYTVRNYIFENNTWSQRGVDVKTWRSSYFGKSLAISADGDTFIAGSDSAFPRVYSFNETLLSTNNYLLKTQISLYPNPTKNYFKVDISNSMKLKKVMIFNTLGKQLLKSNNSLIDISSFQKGIYFAKIITNKGFITQKLIKN